MSYSNHSNTPTSVSLRLTEPLRLPELINAASRSTHSQLNRLIVGRLPLALPPHTSDANIYLKGLLHIAPIYITFESLWQSILDTPLLATVHDRNKNSADTRTTVFPLFDSAGSSMKFNNSVTTPNLVRHQEAWDRTKSALSHLTTPGLARSKRLLADLQPIIRDSQKGLDGQLEEASGEGALADFLAHIRLSVRQNPHVLVAYAWIFYMALFSGGRMLRLSLQTLYIHSDKAGSDLQFFEFDGDEDGEDIRREFKKRFAEVETLLTRDQIQDVVLEAQEIFRFMIQIVFDLDEICSTDKANPMTSEQQGVKPLVQSIKRGLVERENRRSQTETPGEKPKLVHNRSLEIFGLILVLVAWSCFRWWSYPSPVSIASLESIEY